MPTEHAVRPPGGDDSGGASTSPGVIFGERSGAIHVCGWPPRVRARSAQRRAGRRDPHLCSLLVARTMISNAFRLLSVLLTAVAMAAAFAHLLGMPNKLSMSREDYFTAQQVYRGWALLGVPLFGALIATAVQAFLERGKRRWLTAGAAACIALGLAVFFTFTYPANQQTQNWTAVPDNWEDLRRQWEYAHATTAVLYFAALTLLTLSLLSRK